MSNSNDQRKRGSQIENVAGTGRGWKEGTWKEPNRGNGGGGMM